jgi:outer membrane receptor for Fe3+-dicitrate
MKIFSSNVCALVAGAVVLASVPLGAATVKADKQASAPVTTVTREDLEKTPGARNAESLREALKKPILNEETGSKTRMSEVLVQAEAEHEGVVQGPFMPDVTGAKIYGGKKTSVVDFDQMPQIQTDNYRQAFAKVPGLLVSELSNPALLNLGSRGIGDPHESQNLLVLKDGVPFVVDMIGYPTVYYAPPFESIDRLEFTRGGSSLLYGPQPSGSLNYVTHAPRRDREYGFHTQHVFGSYGLYSTFNSASGTVGRLGYLVNYDHRQGDGYRNHNSDYWTRTRTRGGSLTWTPIVRTAASRAG